MRWQRCVGFGVAVFLAGTGSAPAQEGAALVRPLPSLAWPEQPASAACPRVFPAEQSASGRAPTFTGQIIPIDDNQPATTEGQAPPILAPASARPWLPGSARFGQQNRRAPDAGSPVAPANLPERVPPIHTATAEGNLSKAAPLDGATPDGPLVIYTTAPAPRPAGPVPVEEVRILQNFGRQGVYTLCDIDPCGACAKPPPVRVYGWVETEYTYRSTGPGPTNVAPVMDRFGNEFLFRQVALRIEKPLDPKDWSWGFNIQPYGGSDAAFLNPFRGAIIRHPDPRFGFDFSDLNLTAHLPVLTEGGVDVIAGRQTTVTGSQRLQAPWRVFASSDYQWYLAEEHEFTGVSTLWHLTPQLDVYAGMEFGWNTFFTSLSVTPTFITQVNYWLGCERRTLLSATVVTGPETPHSGSNTTVVTLGVTQRWSPYLTQIVQSTLGSSRNGVAGLGEENFFGLYNMFVYHLTPRLDTNLRLEWYDDVDGRGYPGGTGYPNDYYEVTLGVDYHPVAYLQIRPELRGDFADRNPAFGAFDHPRKDRAQLTAALEMLLKF